MIIFWVVIAFVLNKLIPNVWVASSSSTMICFTLGKEMLGGHIGKSPSDSIFHGNSGWLLLSSAVVSFLVGFGVNHFSEKKSTDQSARSDEQAGLYGPLDPDYKGTNGPR